MVPSNKPLCGATLPARRIYPSALSLAQCPICSYARLLPQCGNVGCWHRAGLTGHLGLTSAVEFRKRTLRRPLTVTPPGAFAVFGPTVARPERVADRLDEVEAAFRTAGDADQGPQNCNGLAG